MSQQQSISEKVGITQCADGRGAVVYRALRKLFCSRCSQVIAASELFTRWSIHRTATHDEATNGDSPLLSARCRECVPFDFEITAKSDSDLLQTAVTETHETPDVTAQPVRSKLIEHLLGTPTDARSANRTMQKPERIASNATIESHRLIKPEEASRTTVVQIIESAQSAKEIAASLAAEASYSRLAPALNSRNFRAANHRSAWRNKK